MRVVMAANWWYRRGGLGAVMLDEATELGSRGHEVIPFAAAHPDNLATPWSTYFPAFTETAADGRGMSATERVRAAVDLVHDRAAGQAFGRLLDDVRPDLVHFHNPTRQLSPSVIGVAVKHDIPVLLTLHDYSVICPQGFLLKGGTVPCSPPNCVRGNTIHAVTNRCVHGSLAASGVASVEHLIHRALGSYTRRVTRFLAPSRFIAATVADAGVADARVTLLANGIRPGPEPGPLPTAGGHILYTGRLVHEKGVADLLAAARGMPEIPVVVAGDGPLRERLEAERSANVTFVGQRDPVELDALRDRAVAVVSPSIWFENAPLAVLEAMRAGRPVIATAIGGQPELLEGGCGILVAPGDVDGLAAAIRRLWNDRTEAAALGRTGRTRLRERYSLDGHIDGLLRIYGEVAGPRPN
jgi:glycosyltransferase involved in cell wall biosynthesis